MQLICAFVEPRSSTYIDPAGPWKWFNVLHAVDFCQLHSSWLEALHQSDRLLRPWGRLGDMELCWVLGSCLRLAWYVVLCALCDDGLMLMVEDCNDLGAQAVQQ
jgi:hypothetical protein